ncbi:hypothetical protein [Pontibacter beigongshangensis]|uniref:hypothetical protein n=1 Tax=Pontibacter beigongshangensis TaxID=2574733 RepID=UPI0016504E15|nr:hypothetical protein [Pontibacter beigongshangensis]
MENQQNKGLAIFKQICEVNELDPETVRAEAQKNHSEKMRARSEAEKLVWTALDLRARALLQKTGAKTMESIKGDGGEYSIDADPAAPGFVVNEDTIRSKHQASIAEYIIEALAGVKLPVQA